MPRLMLAVLVLLTLVATSLAGENVHAFLGGRLPDESKPLPPEKWSATENVVWKTDVPGRAWSSPIVHDGKVFLTTCISTGKEHEARKGLYLEDVDANKYPKPTDVHNWMVLALDLNSGRKLWEHTAHSAIPARAHHIKNSLASESPVTDGERIYAYFGNVGIFCYDLNGKPLWSKLFPAYDNNYSWGTSISPIVHDGRVYIVNDNDEQSYIVALDAATGEEKLRIDRPDEKTNYCMPFIWQNDQRTELVTSGINWARSYDLQGNLLWKLKGKSILAIPTPFAYKGNLLLTAGHVVWGENPMYLIRPGGSGDISPAEKTTTNDHIVWSTQKAGPYHPTPLVYHDQMYILYDRGLLASMDPATGKEIYPRKRIPDGRAFTSSPWAYGGKVFCLNEDGVTFAIKAGETFEISHTNKLADDDMGMATPLVVGDKLLIRTSPRIYCIGTANVAAK